MSENRLTAERFGELLTKHPDFHICHRWIDSPGTCGGCAMTLAYHDANPGFSLHDSTQIRDWAWKVYGQDYTDGFIAGFDGRDRDPEGDDWLAGFDDGVACVTTSDAMCR